VGTITVTKRLFGSTLAVYVEGVRVRENIVISVSGLVGRDDTLACFNKLVTIDFRVSEEDIKTNELMRTHLPSKGYVNFGNTASGHSRCRVESAKLFDKSLREGWVCL
jgi:hypothetical protein